MKPEKRRFPAGTAVIMPVHSALCAVRQLTSVSEKRLLWFGAVLLVFLVTFSVMMWEMRLFTQKTSRISVFMREFLPCLLQAGAIAAAELTAAFLLARSGAAIWEPEAGYLWAGSCTAMLLTGAVVIFAAGASRTMLYHDEKR